MKVIGIQYPSGGFGHFLHVVLNRFCPGFSNIDKNYKFGPGGDSHDYPCLLPKYYTKDSFNVAVYQKIIETLSNDYVTFLIDCGLNDDSDSWKQFVRVDNLIRICYNDRSWPLLAKMFYTRCMSAVDQKKYRIEDFILPEETLWPGRPDWAIREKFFLYLRDHQFRKYWRPTADAHNIEITTLFDYDLLRTEIAEWNPNAFDGFYKNWFEKNREHFDFYFHANQISTAIKKNIPMDIRSTKDIFTQATVYYFLWLDYEFAVPHNEHANWFNNTHEIVALLQKNQIYQ